MRRTACGPETSHGDGVEWRMDLLETYMKPQLSRVLAGLLAAGALPLAVAQTQTPVAPPAPAAPALQYVNEPVASSSVANAEGPVSAIVQQLNADASMEGSKITVQPDGETVILTGVTRTYAQAIQASKAAASHAGEGKVVNAILHEELVMAVPEPRVAANAADAAAESEAAPADAPAAQGSQPSQPAQPAS